jgi:hypothetical protein
MSTSGHTAVLAALGAFAVAGQVAAAEVTLLSQQRVITVSTTADASQQMLAAANFDPFVETLSHITQFLTQSGGTGVNRADAGIDCQIDPDAIRASGSLGASGGINVTGVPEFGEAHALIEVTFSVAEPTRFSLFASPRPSDDPRDEFEVELENLATGQFIVRHNETQPAQTINAAGVLQPGTYIIHYEVEFSASGPDSVRNFAFNVALGTTCGSADFNHDTDAATDADIEAFFACLAGTCCLTCGSADFNGDGEPATDADIEAFFRVLAGLPC